MTNMTSSFYGKFLIFTLQKQIYGIPISSVKEINRMSEVTPVPQTKSFVSGVMNLRGKVIPVIDLRLRLGMQKGDVTRDTCIVVIENNDGQVGMIVDAVSSVMDLTSEQIETESNTNEIDKSDLVIGLGKTPDQVIVLIDGKGVLTKTDYESLETNTTTNAA